MIGGVTRRGLPHLPGVPHLHVKNGKGTGAEMRPAIVSGIVTENALVSYWPITFPVPSPEVFVKDNSVQSPWVVVFIVLSSLRYHEGDVNENVKKAIA